MSAAGSYPLPNVPTRRSATAEPHDSEPDDARGSSAPAADAEDSPRNDRVDLSGLSVAGLSRRRVGLVAGAFLGAWIVIVFARQVGAASDATNRAAQMAADNAALAAEVQSLQGEVNRI